MPSCLGIYIEDNIIKYAKVSKEREAIKLDAFGVKFYDKLEESIEQIINETFSYNIPISTNLVDESYNYFDMFSLLSEKDMAKAIETEFELLCDEKGYNKSNIESRFMLVNNQENREKTKAMHISCNKTEINKIVQTFQKYRLKSISPLPVSIVNNIELGVKQNAAILNLEEQISLTTIINGQVNRVDILDKGMSEIYEKINRKENSYAKVYDILKNTTIYTSEGKDLSDNESNYLQDIMPTLYEIITKVKDNISQNINNIDNLYITGTGAIINNIDLYFQEYLQNTKCVILRPYFMKNVSMNQISIKDYIEVNSATALGIQCLEENKKDLNFKNSTAMEKLKEIGNMQIGGSKGKEKKNNGNGKGKKINFKFDLSAGIDITERRMLRVATTFVIVAIVYIIISSIIASMIKQKTMQTEEVISDTNAQISKAETDTQTINNKIAEYNTLIKKLDEINQKIADENSARNAIPNLLSRIMVHIPKDVQVTSISNTTGKHVVINVQAVEYDPIGYFLGAINTNEILVNARSSNSVKQNGIIRITIEGDMP